MKPEHEQYILKNIETRSIQSIAGSLGIKERKVKKFLEKCRMKHKKEGEINTGQRVDDEKTSSAKPIISILSVVLIVLLGIIVYWNSLDGEFIWDDIRLVNENLYIRSWSHLSRVFSENIGAGSGSEYGFYRPVQTVTYMADYALWQLDAKGYHLTNILLHVLGALCVYWLIKIISKNEFLPLLTAVFFVVHPAHVEVVTYISGRADALSLLFMVICFVFFVQSAAQHRTRFYILMIMSYILALLSKENSLVLPLLLLFYRYAFGRKNDRKELMTIIGLAAAYLWLRVAVLEGAMPQSVNSTTLFERLPASLAALTGYIRLLILPFDLHMEYGHRIFHWMDPKVFLGLGLLLAMLGGIVKLRKSSPIICFGLGWFLIGLAPVSNIYPINAYMAEHWLYFPSVGLFIVVAKGMTWLLSSRRVAIPTAVLIIGLLGFYGYLTAENNRYWISPKVFYERLINYAQDSPRAHIELGLVYSAEGRHKEAEQMLKKAVAIKPDYAEAYNSLGATYDAMGKKAEALAMFKKAIEIEPDYARAHNNLAIYYFYQNNFTLAIEYCDKAKQLGFVNPAIEEALKPFR